jgi:ankyrin repeat protein
MLDMGGYGTGARYTLEMAIRHDNVALARWALEHGASSLAVPARDPRMPGSALYEEAIRRGRVRIAELLLKHGAPPVALQPSDEEAFIAACFERDAGRARALVARQPDLLASTEAIDAAAKTDRADVAELLLDLGMSIELENRKHQRPLHFAAWHDAADTARLLIGRGAAIDPVESEWNNTPLDFAVYGLHMRTIQVLVPHSRDISNLVFVGAVERLRELIEKEPDLARTTAAGGETPLMWLCDDELAAAAIVRLFLENGADAAARSGEGLTAADYASRRGLTEAAALLRAAGSSGDSQ